MGPIDHDYVLRSYPGKADMQAFANHVRKLKPQEIYNSDQLAYLEKKGLIRRVFSDKELQEFKDRGWHLELINNLVGKYEFIEPERVSEVPSRQFKDLEPFNYEKWSAENIDMNPETVGAFERFHVRVAKFRSLGRSVWVHAFWWVVHNCVAHPLIGILPWFKWTFTFHDWTSLKINASE